MTTLKELQKKLTQYKADAYLVTRNNMFLGKDVLPQENKITELTGFTGSAGNLIVFRDKAVLLVDGRYDIQARQQTDADKIEVVCTRDSIGSWIQHNVQNNCKFIYDPWCHAISETDYWKRALSRHEFIEDKDQILGNRTIASDAEIFELKEEFAGISSEEKISYLTKFCTENKIDGYLLTECDTVSWLMNLRSNLLKDTPILRAFALVSASGDVSLFMNDFGKLETELDNWQDKNIGVAYNRCPKKLKTLMKDRHIWLTNLNNPVTEWKACKNPVEIAGFKKAHIRDAVAVCQFLHWFDNNWQSLDELQIVAKLREFREQQQYFYSDSFATIAGYGANGAIIHYQPTAETNRKLQDGSVLLLDSGAQYFDATTDITRTLPVGIVPDEIINSYTEVLKAHIAVADAVFPLDTPGHNLDTLSRAALWQFGKDYEHGTGHGVGHFLCVHEGPQSLSTKGSAPLKKDMVTSIEPGFYKEDAYGIRLENLALIVETSEFAKPMLKFKPLTLVPFDRRLINKSLLTAKELEWLNNYHQKVFAEVSPFLSGETLQWLKKMTQKI